MCVSPSAHLIPPTPRHPQDGNKPWEARKGTDKGTEGTCHPATEAALMQHNLDHVMLHLKILLPNLHLSGEAFLIHQKLSRYHLRRNDPAHPCHPICHNALTHALTELGLPCPSPLTLDAGQPKESICRLSSKPPSGIFILHQYRYQIQTPVDWKIHTPKLFSPDKKPPRPFATFCYHLYLFC